MKLLAILMGLTWQLGGPGLSQDKFQAVWRWYFGWFKRWSWFQTQPEQLQWLTALLPVLAAYALLWIFFASALWGWGLLMLYLALFLITVPGLKRISEMNILLSYMRAQDWEQVRTVAEKQFDMQLSEESQELCYQIYGLWMSSLWRELFTPLFWFTVLGPVGGLICLFAFVLADQPYLNVKLSGFSQTVLEKIGLIPARLLACALIGASHATEKLELFKQVLMDWKTSNDALLKQLPQKLAGDVSAAFFSDLYTLIKRSLFLWLGVISVCLIIF